MLKKKRVEGFEEKMKKIKKRKEKAESRKYK